MRKLISTIKWKLGRLFEHRYYYIGTETSNFWDISSWKNGKTPWGTAHIIVEQEATVTFPENFPMEMVFESITCLGGFDSTKLSKGFWIKPSVSSLTIK